VTERATPLPTMIDEGSVELGGRTIVKLPAFEVVWLEASESMTYSVTVGGVKAMVLKELASECWSQVPMQGDHVGDATCWWCIWGTGRGANRVPPRAP
jgi:hypothetical protein